MGGQTAFPICIRWWMALLVLVRGASVADMPSPGVAVCSPGSGVAGHASMFDGCPAGITN